MILSLVDAQKLDPNVTQGQLDAYEAAIRQLSANNFQARKMRFRGIAIQGLTITAKEGDMHVLRAGDTLQLTDTGGYDEALVALATSSSDGATIQDGVNDGGKLIDGDYPLGFATLVRYPPDVVEGVRRLIAYDRDMAGKIGVKSESISRMSVTYYDVNASETLGGYPANLLDFVRKHERIRWGS